jgi:hypothetical protein
MIYLSFIRRIHEKDQEKTHRKWFDLSSFLAGK